MKCPGTQSYGRGLNATTVHSGCCNTFSYCVRGRGGWGRGFGPRPTHCAQCGNSLPDTSIALDGATGYGCGKGESIAAHPDAPALHAGESLERSPAVCYACCALNDTRGMSRYRIRRARAYGAHFGLSVVRRGANTYDVFVRDWWRAPDPGEPQCNGRVPYPGAPRKYIARGVSYDEALAICAEYRASHEPGWRSRKAEFEAA